MESLSVSIIVNDYHKIDKSHPTDKQYLEKREETKNILDFYLHNY